MKKPMKRSDKIAAAVFVSVGLLIVVVLSWAYMRENDIRFFSTEEEIYQAMHDKAMKELNEEWEKDGSWDEIDAMYKKSMEEMVERHEKERNEK